MLKIQFSKIALLSKHGQNISPFLSWPQPESHSSTQNFLGSLQVVMNKLYTKLKFIKQSFYLILKFSGNTYEERRFYHIIFDQKVFKFE